MGDIFDQYQSLVGVLEHGFFFPIQLGIDFPQLTNSIIFSEG